MNDKKLADNYLALEQEVYPIKDFLEANKENEKYKNLYKGFITLQSPLALNPDILFIGINPGDGAFKESQIHHLDSPIRTFEQNPENYLNWYKDGNARGGKIDEIWSSHKWYERKARINNPFVANMIDLLYNVDKIKNPNIEANNNELPSWYKGFGHNIMFTNLYPISTKNTTDLKRIFSLLSNKPQLFSKESKSISKWDVQKYFIMKIERLIKLVNPKVIVCLGTQAFNDLTYTSSKKEAIVFKGIKYTHPVIGFSREWGWNKSIPAIAQAIVDEMK